MVLKSAKDSKDFLDLYDQYRSQLNEIKYPAARLQVLGQKLQAHPLYSSVLTLEEQSEVVEGISKAVAIVPDPKVILPD